MVKASAIIIRTDATSVNIPEAMGNLRCRLAVSDLAQYGHKAASWFGTSFLQFGQFNVVTDCLFQAVLLIWVPFVKIPLWALG
jgi:hypothetical protein